MKHGLQDIDWAYVGAALANEGDDNQSIFFKAFVKECQAWGTAFQFETQMAFINGRLTTKEREVLAMLGYERKEPA